MQLESSIINIVIAFTAVWIVNRYWGIFFEKKKISFMSVVIYISYFCFQLIFQCKRGNINLLQSLINVIFILLIAKYRYHCEGKRKYFLLIIFYSVWTLLESFVFFLLIPIQKELFNQDIAGVVISNILMIILVYMVSLTWNKVDGEMLSNKFYLLLLLIPMGSIYIAVNEFYYKVNSISSMIIMSILLLFNVVIFEIYIKTNEVFTNEKEKTAYAQQINITAEKTIEQKKMLEEFHEERHNLINELVALKGGIEGNNKESVIRNLNKIINNFSKTENISNSGNSTVDAIINFKYYIAKEYGIEFILNIFIPDELPIEQCEIGVVLGNAIEAVKKCKTKKKTVEISMGVKKESWVMVVKNPYENEIKKDRNGKILSTKRSNFRQGYGLRSIEKIAEEYQGEVIIDAEDGKFSLIVVLNFKEF